MSIKLIQNETIKIIPSFIVIFCLFIISKQVMADHPKSQDYSQPNILMILVDDLGYTDIGSYGGNIDTPNIDSLGFDGVRFSNAHVYPSCAPTRAAFMTGKNPHKVGFGSQNNMAPPGVSLSAPGYSGSLEGDFTGLAEILRSAGYNTFISGKWHLGFEDHQSPKALGFDKHYTLLDGAASHYSDMSAISLFVSPSGQATYTHNGKKIDSLPDDFYSTRNYTEELIKMIRLHEDGDKPFFAYLSYTAVHDPLHAPEDLIMKYMDEFHDGFEKLRDERIRNAVKHGLILDSSITTRWITDTPSWNELTELQRKDMAMRMATYAAMLDFLDAEVGRLIDYLKEIGVYENTLIVFTSDNGAAPVPRTFYARGEQDRKWQSETYFKQKIEDYGKPHSFPTMGMPNAQASSGPFFAFKTNLHEGGTRVPMIIKAPGKDHSEISDTYINIADLYNTFADYAGVDITGQSHLLGTSFKPYLTNDNHNIDEREWGMEYMGWRAYRAGDWKLVFVSKPFGGTGKWALYDLSSDLGETVDLSREYPAKVSELSEKWHTFANKNGIIVVPMELVNSVSTSVSEMLLSIDWADE